MSDFSFANSVEPKWYVAHTYSGYENKVKTNLEKIIENRGLSDVILDVRVPTEIKVIEETKKVKKKPEDDEDISEDDFFDEKVEETVTKEVETKIYPCYVLVKMIMNDMTWHVVRNITGVTGFVGPGSKPVPLEDSEVEAMGVEITKQDLSFSIGDQVQIISGPFDNYTGKVEEISDDKKTVKVLVSMFGRETPVEVSASSVKPL